MDNLLIRGWSVEDKKYYYTDILSYMRTREDMQDKIFPHSARDFGIELCTGKKDINNFYIYQNDIVTGNFPYAKKGMVVWDESRCGFFIKPIDGLGKAAYDKYYKMNACKLCVIGNINEKI